MLSRSHIVFLYKIKDGKSHRSYGINVAKLAKLPDHVIDRAQLILNTLEAHGIEQTLESSQQVVTIQKESQVEELLRKIDPMAISPIEALSQLIELKKLL